MTLTPIDWIIIAVYLAGCIVAGVWMRRYVRSVEDFAIAGREMDLHLGIASLAATEVGIVTVMYAAEMGFKNGLAGAAPGVLGCVAMLAVGLTGFVIVPLRNAGVMTIPELFEKRFGKHVRWLAGLVVILGGVLNMGIFLRLGGDFLMYVSGLDPTVTYSATIFGAEMHFRCLELMMTGLLAIILLYTVLGGMISVLVTDYLQFLVMGLGIVVTSVLVVWNVGWPRLIEKLPEAHQVTVAMTEAQEAAQAAGQAAEAAGASSDESEAKANVEIAGAAFEAADARRQKLFEEAFVAKRLAETPAADASPAYDPAVAAERASVLAEIARKRMEQVAALRAEAVKVAQTTSKQARGAVAEAHRANERSAAAAKQFDQAAQSALVRPMVLEEAAKLAARRASNRDASSGAADKTARLLAEEAAAARPAAVEAEKAKRAAEDAEKLAAQAGAAAASASDGANLAAEKVRGNIGPLAMTEPFNPFSPNGLGWAWFAWQAMTQIAVMTTWQTTIARVLACRDAHTAKRMYCGTCFYFVGRFGLPGLWGIGAFLYFWNLGGLPEGVDSLKAMPAYLHTILPAGLLGLVVAAMLAAEMSTDSGYLVTWATVIYNDLIGPCLRKPMSPRTKLFTVRSLVLAIGVFLVFYGLWYPLPGAAWDYLAVTGNIYLASLFTLLVGALYWKGANSWGAVSAIVLGAIGPLAFVIVNAFVPKEYHIPAEVAGWSAFGLSFAGMYFGSMIGRAMGKGLGAGDWGLAAR